MSTLQRIEKVLRAALEQPALKIDETMSAKNVAHWDSFSHISIVIGLEKEFSITFADDELAALQNIGEMVVIINDRAAVTARV